MNVCTKQNTHNFTIGNLYKCDQEGTQVCLAISRVELVVLKSGMKFKPDIELTYLNVTDKYCLQEI